MAGIMVPIPPGELVDKITILEIKAERIADRQKVTNVRLELDLLQRTLRESDLAEADVADQTQRLKSINERLWDIEDRIRLKESSDSFDQEFIELARSVYLINDERARVKREINELLGSTLIEEKSYTPY
jgi:hypothetical protein